MIGENVIYNGRCIVLLALMIMSLLLMPLVLLLSLLFVIIGRLFRAWHVLLLLGICLSISLWATEHISPVMIMQLAPSLKELIVTGNLEHAFNSYLVLVSLPMAILLAVLLNTLMIKKTAVQKELSRVAKGKPVVNKKTLSPKQIQKGIKAIDSGSCTDGSILGIDMQSGEQVILTDKAANMHTFAIGTTGSGKTTTINNIVESAIRRKLPLFYVDGKGDMALAERIGQYAKDHKRPFYLFTMVGESVHYNPIASGGITSKKDRIIELRQWSEDHYRKIAEGYLQTVFAILDKFEVNCDLSTLGYYLNPDNLYDLARQKQDSSCIPDIEMLESRQKDIQSLIAEIDNMTKSEIGYLFGCRDKKTLILEKALSEKAIVYFCLQSLAFPSYAEALGKLIINDIKAMAASQLRQNHKQTIYTIFDEFSVFAGDQVINLINQGRGAGIHAVLATQSLSDIAKKGGEALVGQVLNNCNNYIIQRQNNHDDAEVLANLIGTIDKYQLTSQVDKASISNNVGSVRQSKEFIVHPDEIKQFKQGEGVYYSKLGRVINTTAFMR